MSSKQTPGNFRGKSRMTSAAVLSMETNDLARRIGDRLSGAFAGERHAAKRLAQVTGASNRTAENWLRGENSPDALHLLKIMALVPAVAREVLDLTGHPADVDPEFMRDFARAMQTFQRAQETRNAAMALDRAIGARGTDAAAPRPPHELARGPVPDLDGPPRPMVEEAR